MDVHERRQRLAEARLLIADAVFAVLAEADAEGGCLSTIEIARRLEWIDYYDTIRDVLRGMKRLGFVVDYNEDGGYRQWALPEGQLP